MDLSILAKDAVCHVCGKKGHFAKDCWHQSGNKGSGKGKKGKKGQGKGTKPKDGNAKQIATTVARSVTLHVIVRRSKQCKIQWWRRCTLLDVHR